MKQIKKLRLSALKQKAEIIDNKQQLHQIKGGDIVGAEDFRTGIIGEDDYRN